jgi:hypothetical protein
LYGDALIVQDAAIKQSASTNGLLRRLYALSQLVEVEFKQRNSI